MLLRILDRLEETIIAFLMAAATLVIFFAVLHRYLAGVPVIQDYVLRLDTSWAQELCIIMFVWMCKFGAAYGVRTGIHVGVDVLINRFDKELRRKVVLFGLLAGTVFTGAIAALGAHLEWPTWMVYSAIPLGSALMCFRFLQVTFAFWKTGELPVHDHAFVAGVDPDAPMVGEAIASGEAIQHAHGSQAQALKTQGGDRK